MEELKTYIVNRISRLSKRVDELKLEQGDNPSETHTYHGGWELGYWKGRLSAFEDIMDTIEEIN